MICVRPGVVVARSAGRRCAPSPRRRRLAAVHAGQALEAARSGRCDGSRRPSRRSASARAAPETPATSRQRVVVDLLAADAECAQRRHRREARETPRLPKFGHSRPQNPSSVCDRLSASKPSSVATASCARSRRRRGIAAMCRIATSSLNRPSAPSTSRFGSVAECAKPSDVMPVTCQNRSRSTTPSRPARLARPALVNGPSISRRPRRPRPPCRRADAWRTVPASSTAAANAAGAGPRRSPACRC